MNKVKKFFNNIKVRLHNSKRTILILIILLLIILIVILIKSISNISIIKNQISKKQELESTQKLRVSVEVKEWTDEEYKCLIVFTSTNENVKIKSIQFPEEDERLNIIETVNKEGKEKIGIDYIIKKDDIEKKFNIEMTDGEIIEKEIVRYMENIYAYTTEEYQEFVAKHTGNYKIECWGATGGKATGISQASGTSGQRATGIGGIGGYTSGKIYIQKGEKLYVYVGAHGTDAIAYRDSPGGYNGGGLGTWDYEDDEAAGAGGGATDIRLVAGEWSDFNSLKSRIMVAAGGAGAAWKTNGGAGGGWQGLTNRVYSVPGTQISGYKFGIGQDGYGVGSSDGVAGAGGGYYGGTTSDVVDAAEAGAGGSSFISGNENCDAISEESTEDNIIHTNQPIHYSGKYFTNSFTEDGNNLTHISLDKAGNGFAKITLLDE